MLLGFSLDHLAAYEDRGRNEGDLRNTDTGPAGMTRKDPYLFGEEYEKD